MGQQLPSEQSSILASCLQAQSSQNYEVLHLLLLYRFLTSSDTKLDMRFTPYVLRRNQKRPHKNIKEALFAVYYSPSFLS